MAASVLMVSAVHMYRQVSHYVQRCSIYLISASPWSNMSISGTVFDDISMRGCIAQTECQCKHDKVYNTGEVYRQDREEWYA